MKKYKLLKESVDAYEGTLFEKYSSFEYKYTDKSGLCCKIHQGKVEGNPDWFEEVKHEWKKWKPSLGNDYYRISFDFNSVEYYEAGLDYYVNKWNLFKSKEQAEWVLDRLKLLIEMKEFADEWNPMYENEEEIKLCDALPLLPILKGDKVYRRFWELFSDRIKELKP